MLSGIMLVVPGVLAATTAEVSGNPVLTMSFAVTGSQSFGDMTTGAENVNTTGNSVMTTLTTNAPWAITVSDALDGPKPAGTEGRMAEYGGAAYIVAGKTLINALNVGSASDTYVVLSGAESAPLWTGDAVTSQNNYPWFKQTVDALDTRAGFGHTYRIVVTFTATPA